jgi:hypothetical protein
VIALLLLVLVAVAAGAFVFAGGIDLVTDLIAGDTVADDIVPIAPAEPSTPAVEEPPAVPVTTGPTDDQQARMYGEQVASQEQIGKLVAGDITALELGEVNTTGSSATVRVTAVQRGGGSVSGTMVLRDYDGVWYFSSITRDGNSGSTPAAAGDSGVISAIVTAQAENQEIPTGIVAGSYKKLTVGDIKRGSGTVAIEFTLSGGPAAETAGTITCIGTEIGGVEHWFITSFARR